MPIKNLLALLLLLLFQGCDDYQQMTKQTPTFANLLNITKAIERVVRSEGSISDAEAEAIISIVTRFDSWGGGIIFRARRDAEFSYIVVSLGRDGKLDVDDIDVYFELPQEDIYHQFDRDIVFRDGKPVTLASHK